MKKTLLTLIALLTTSIASAQLTAEPRMDMSAPLPHWEKHRGIVYFHIEEGVVNKLDNGNYIVTEGLNKAQNETIILEPWGECFIESGGVTVNFDFNYQKAIMTQLDKECHVNALRSFN